MANMAAWVLLLPGLAAIDAAAEPVSASVPVCAAAPANTTGNAPATAPGSADVPVLSVHCPLGCPQNPPANQLLFTHLYALSNNPQSKLADWVAYEVNVGNFGESPGRNWASDPLLPAAHTLEEADYKDVGKAPLSADRGHLAPLAHFAGSRYWYELNYLSNIAPQHKDLNQGAWKALEDAERAAVSFRQPLYVITGLLFETPMPMLPGADEPHQLPSAFFKVIYDAKGNAAAFYMQQQLARDTPYCRQHISLVALLRKVSYQLPPLKDSERLRQRLGCQEPAP